jgi:hypothetical protein
MKKIHINENQEAIVNEDAKIVNLYDTNLGDFYDEEEEEYITKVSEKLDELIRGLFDLKEYIDNTPEYVSSERGEREIQRIKDTIETLTNG